MPLSDRQFFHLPEQPKSSQEQITTYFHMFHVFLLLSFQMKNKSNILERRRALQHHLNLKNNNQAKHENDAVKNYLWPVSHSATPRVIISDRPTWDKGV